MSKKFSILIAVSVIFLSSIWIYFNSSNYYAFFLPHAPAPDSMKSFDPRAYSTPSRTAQAVPISAIIFALIFLLLVVATLVYLHRHLKRKIINK